MTSHINHAPSRVRDHGLRHHTEDRSDNHDLLAKTLADLPRVALF